MVRDRKGQEDKKIVQEVRENKEMVDFIKSLTKAEMERIKEVREFETIEKDTPTYNIAVMCDKLRQESRKHKITIERRLMSMAELTNNIRRLEVQLASGNITETMKNNIIMNEQEVKSLIHQNEWMRTGEFYALYTTLAGLRATVGHKDVSGKIIMTIKQFDELVRDVENKVKEFGYDFFGDIND